MCLNIIIHQLNYLSNFKIVLNNMSKSLVFISIVALVLIYSCSERRETVTTESQDSILNDVLPVLFEKTIPVVSGKRNIVLYNTESDSILYWALENSSLMNEDVLRSKEKLRSSLSSEFVIRGYKNKSKTPFNFVYKQNDVDSVFKNHVENIVGVVSLRNIVLSEGGEKGIFVYSPQLGELGGGVFLVAIEKQNDKSWAINRIDTLLVGE